MKKYLNVFLFLCLLFNFSLISLNRDYDSCSCTYGRYYCTDAIPDEYRYEWLTPELIQQIPEWKDRYCATCEGYPMYGYYVESIFTENFKNLLLHCNHVSKKYNQECKCFWPETSQQAAKISDLAYNLFSDLIDNTALKKLIKDTKEQKEIFKRNFNLSKHEIIISFIAQQLKFSNYYYLVEELEKYAKIKYSPNEAAKIKDKLWDILEALYPKFMALNKKCYSKHPTECIEMEIRLMKLLMNDPAGLDKINLEVGVENNDENSYEIYDETDALFEVRDLSNHECRLNKRLPKKGIPFDAQADILVKQGALLNDVLAYNKAIEVFSEAIKLNPKNADAFIERAIAYFETNQIELAINDYKKAKKLAIRPPFKAMYIPKNKIEFSTGLILGTLEGANDSTKEFIPSILSSLRGIANGLWAFALSPNEMIDELAESAYAIGDFIASHNTFECLECVIPELKQLSLSWNNINDHAKGQQIGYIIGRYGVEIFAPVGVLKCVSKYRALKKANSMCTLEGCTLSSMKKKKILEESAKSAARREQLLNEAINSGRILYQTENVIPHVMQTHHDWHKVILLSGNIKEDFKKVLSVIEKNNIVHDMNIKKIRKLDVPIEVIKYSKSVNGEVITVFMDRYLEKGESFLKNGYVEKVKK